MKSADAPPEDLPKGWKCKHCKHYIEPPHPNGPPRKRRVVHKPQCSLGKEHFNGPETTKYCHDFRMSGDLAWCYWMLQTNRKIIDD